MAPDCLRQAVQRHLVDWQIGSVVSYFKQRGRIG